MKKLFYTIFFLSLCLQGVRLSAQGSERKDTTIFSESFESSTSRGKWGALASTGCSSYTWGFYNLSGLAAEKTDWFMGYASSQAPQGCYAICYSPSITLNPVTTDDSDSVYVSFYLYRTDINSQDEMGLEIVDGSGNALAGPVAVYQYAQAAPVTDTGWVQLFWKIPYTSISSSTSAQNIKLGIVGFSDHNVNILVDEVQLHQVYHKYKKTITISKPVAGDKYGEGFYRNIEWTSSAVDKVKLEYSLNGGSSWTTIEPSYDAIYYYYSWQVPSTITNKALVRISDASDTSVNDVSDTFSIVKPILLKTPNDGSTLYGGDKVTISWDAMDEISNDGVDIDYSSDGGQNWTSVASNQMFAQTYNWTVPKKELSNVILRVKDHTYSNYYDVSKSFAIELPLKLKTLLGGDDITGGSKVPIKWTNAPSVKNLNIFFTINGGVNWNQVASNVDASTGSYNWTVPDVPTTTAKVRLVDADDNTNIVESDNYFTIEKGTGIQPLNEPLSFSLYPNPSHGQLTLSMNAALPTRASLAVVDVTGKTIYSQQLAPGTQTLNIDLGHIAAGMYNLVLTSDKGSFRSQLMIK